MLANAAYHVAVISGLTIGYADNWERLPWVMGHAPQLDKNGCNIGVVILNVGVAMATRDMLINQGLLLADILK